jgi:hypothetical protein
MGAQRLGDYADAQACAATHNCLIQGSYCQFAPVPPARRELPCLLRGPWEAGHNTAGITRDCNTVTAPLLLPLPPVSIMGSAGVCFRSDCLVAKRAALRSQAIETIDGGTHSAHRQRPRTRESGCVSTANRSEAWRSADVFYRGLKMVDGRHSLRLPSSKPFGGAANGQSWLGRNAKESLTDLGGSQSKDPAVPT